MDELIGHKVRIRWISPKGDEEFYDTKIYKRKSYALSVYNSYIKAGRCFYVGLLDVYSRESGSWKK